MSAQTAPVVITRYVSPRQLQQATGLSEATLWRLRQRGELPEPVRLSPGRVAWPEPIISAWLATRGAPDSNAPGRGNGTRA
jgi:predicted DNA-binding transcriptional regulator AlpA